MATGSSDLLTKIRDFLGTGLAPMRDFSGGYIWPVRVVGFIFAIYFLFGAVNGSITVFGPSSWNLITLEFPYLPYYISHYSLPLFIFFTSVLTFMVYPARKGSPQHRPSSVDFILCILSLVVLLEFIYFYDERGDRAGLVEWNDVVFGFIAACLAWETCRRVLGLTLPIVAVVFLFYDWAGPFFPGLLAHKGADFGYVMSYLYSESGIYGIITRIYAQVVFIFLIFGALLRATGVGDVFVDLSFALVGRLKGGAAKAAVISSGMVGSIVGSGAANIAITGTFTIPLMKRGGFRPTYAAAVEAVASIGGHLMPPVMASAAFILAAMTETPYYKVALLSLVPAILYYLSVFMSVHYNACKHNLEGVSKERLPDFWGILRNDGILLLPIGTLIMLLLLRFSPFYAAFWSIMTAIVINTIKGKCWMMLGLQAAVFVASVIYGGYALFFYIAIAVGLAYLREDSRQILINIAGAFVEGSVNSLVIGVTAGVMGLVLTGVTHPDLAQKMTAIILSYSNGIIFLAVLLVALASYILGMGMTITASYIVISILASPALQDLGLSMFTAHMIILWLSQDAALTPPFALGAFVAAGVANCAPMKTGFISLRLAKPLYIIPLLMAYTPILMNGPLVKVVTVWVTAALGFICSAAVFEGYFIRRLRLIDYILLSFASLGFFIQNIWFNLAAVVLSVLSILIQRVRPLDIAASAASASIETPVQGVAFQRKLDRFKL